ncbi:hypothetical protein GCM10027056_00120 [Glaciibacter psychrotolerans]
MSGAVKNRRRGRRARLVTVAGISLALSGVLLIPAGSAFAFWTASSTGNSAHAAAGTLAAPVLSSDTLAPTMAELSWTQPFTPTGYLLTQTPGVLAGCAANPAPAATSCAPSGLTPNTTYTWGLSASLHNWAAMATTTATTSRQFTTTTLGSITPTTGSVGDSFTAKATVTGNSGYGAPAGNATFRLYANADCSGPANFTTPDQAITGGSANGSLKPTVGTYHWQAAYTPSDAYNTASTSACSTTAITVHAAGGPPPVPPAITVSTSPVGVVASPDGKHVYVADFSVGTVSVIDTATNAVSALNVGGNPYELALSPDGKLLYVTRPYVNAVIVVNVATNTIVKSITVGTGVGDQYPYGLSMTPDGKHVYVANSRSASVSVIDTVTNTVTATISVGVTPDAVAVSPDGAHVYVTNASSNTVSVIATASNTVSATIAVAATPDAVAVSPDGKRVYVTTGAANTLTVINAVTNSVIANIPVGSNPDAVALSPDGTRVYVANSNSNTVSVIDSATNTVVMTIPVGLRPVGVAVSPDGTRVYVANESSYTVSVIAVPVMTAGVAPVATVGVTYSFTIPAANVTSFAVTTGALPAGLSLDAATGVISGTPTTAGPVTFTITGTGEYGRAALPYTIITAAT